MGRADLWLAPRLRKAPPAPVLSALRLGAVEIGEGAAAHGVVNAMAGLMAAHRRTEGISGLVNAILRALAIEGPANAGAGLKVLGVGGP